MHRSTLDHHADLTTGEPRWRIGKGDLCVSASPSWVQLLSLMSRPIDIRGGRSSWTS